MIDTLKHLIPHLQVDMGCSTIHRYIIADYQWATSAYVLWYLFASSFEATSLKKYRKSLSSQFEVPAKKSLVF